MRLGALAYAAGSPFVHFCAASLCPRSNELGSQNHWLSISSSCKARWLKYCQSFRVTRSLAQARSIKDRVRVVRVVQFGPSLLVEVNERPFTSYNFYPPHIYVFKFSLSTPRHSPFARRCAVSNAVSWSCKKKHYPSCINFIIVLSLKSVPCHASKIES